MCFDILRVYTLSDVEAVDISFYNSLQYVLDNDPEPLDLNFSVLEETFGDVCYTCSNMLTQCKRFITKTL